jgi:DNA mismatch repair protein MSH6
LPPHKKEREEKKKKSNAAAAPAEVAGRRLRLYWPLNKAWYEGRVDTFEGGGRAS